MDNPKARKRLGELLAGKGLVTPAQLEEALAEQKRTKEFLGTILVKHSIIKEEDLGRVLSEQFRMPFMQLKDEYIHWDFVAGFSSNLIVEHKCFPLTSDEWSVTFAIVNPLDLWALQRAEEESRGLRAKFVVVSESDMREVISRYKTHCRGAISKLF